MTALTYPSGRVVRYERDAQGRVEAVTTEKDGVVTPLAAAIRYAPFGAMTAMEFGNGLLAKMAYDLDGKPIRSAISGQDGAVRDAAYGFDAAARLIEARDAVAGDQRFAYDANGRLIAAGGPYGELAYDYDANANRLSRAWTQGGASLFETYLYESFSNRLSSVIGPDGERAFEYDEAGRLVADRSPAGALVYGYDLAGRLVEIALDGEGGGQGPTLSLVAGGPGPDNLYTTSADERFEGLAGNDSYHFRVPDFGSDVIADALGNDRIDFRAIDLFSSAIAVRRAGDDAILTTPEGVVRVERQFAGQPIERFVFEDGEKDAAWIAEQVSGAPAPNAGPDIVATRAYDPWERRVRRQDARGARTFAHDFAGRLLEERDGGTLRAEYVYLHGLPLAMIADAGTAAPRPIWLHADHVVTGQRSRSC